MCINCNLIVPLTDDCADILEVPRRKYLTLGHITNSIMFKNHKKIIEDFSKNNTSLLDMPRYESGYSNNLVNYLTANFLKEEQIKYFEWEDNLDDKKIVKDGVNLYESKIKILKPLPKVLKTDNHSNYYSELFDGDIKFEED